MKWTPEAAAAIKKVPFFVRKKVRARVETEAASAGGGSDHVVTAPMPGAVVRVLVSEGDSVSEGDVLLVQEAMKMETEVKSKFSGTVSRISVNVGDQITAGQELVHISA